MKFKLVTTTLLSIFLLTACGNSFNPNFQATYKIIPYTGNEKITLDTIKPILENRLKKLNIRGSEVRIENNQLVTDVDADIYDIAKASTIANQFDLILQEPREQLTDEEKQAMINFNQGQRSLLTQAHDEATAHPDDINNIVINFSERVNQLQKGIKGPNSKAKVKEDKYWEALEKTDSGKITPIVEIPNAIWFAKVLEKSNDNKTIKYQEVIRFLKLPEPRLNYAPVAHLGQYITNAEIVKKDPNSDRAKNYSVKITLNDAGKQKLQEISEKYKGKTLRYFVDDFPYAKFTFNQPITDGIIILDDDYNQQEANLLVSQLGIGYMPTLLTLTSFTSR